MGFFSRLFGGDATGDIQEIAEEIDRYADRFENADDNENAALARGYAARVRKTTSYPEAKALKLEFLAIINKSTSADNDYDRTRTLRDDDFNTESDDNSDDS